MTVTNTDRTASLACDGITTSWPLPFGFDHPKDLAPVLVVTDGDLVTRTALAWPADFDAVANSNQGGTFTTTTVYGSDAVIEIQRDTVPLQERDIGSKARLDLEGIERALDRLTYGRQDELARRVEAIARTLRLPDNETGTIEPLPHRALRAGKLLGFDDAGQPIATEGAPGGGGSGGGNVVELHDLIDDGETGQAAELEALLRQAVDEGWPELRIIGKTDGSSALRIERRIVLDAMPPRVVIRRVRLIREKLGEIYIRGQEVELPATGKAKLWADVDVSGGPVAAFDIDVGPNAGIVALLVPGAIVRVRGQNGADGVVLDGHEHEAEVVSLVQVSGNRYTLTLSAGLPNTVGGTWRREWPGSQHVVDPDETLISMLAMARATSDLTDSAAMAIGQGVAAALGLAVGQWVEVLDDAKGSDFHGTSAEPLHRQMAQIAAVAAGAGEEPDTVTFAEPIRGALTVARRARLVQLAPVAPFEVNGPGEAFPVRFVGTPDPAPARRVHFLEVRYCLRPRVTGFAWAYEPAHSYTRGAFIRDTLCFEPCIERNSWRAPEGDFAPAFLGGDCYGYWSKGSVRPTIAGNVARGGRHGIVVANATGFAVLDNELGGSAFQCLDCHGESEEAGLIHGNRIARGAPWAGRDRQIAIQIGNQTHTFGSRSVVVDGNVIEGFDRTQDVGVLIVSGCRRILVRQDMDLVGRGVVVAADRRAPAVPITGIAIYGRISRAAEAIVVDGRMPAWMEGAEFLGSATRPTYCEHAGLLWSTTDEGLAGATPPDAGESPVIGTTTHDDGELLWTYRGDVVSPIDGVIVSAVLEDSPAPLAVRRATRVYLAESVIDGPAGVVLGDCPDGLLTDIVARIDSDGDWLVDEGGNDGTVLARIEAGTSGIDDTGASTFVFRTAVPDIANSRLLYRKADGTWIGLEPSDGIAIDEEAGTLSVESEAGGTVTSVAVSGTDGIEVDSGSPVTSSGTITLGVNAATLRGHLNVANGANNYAHPNHSGDVISVGDGETTIANGVVTDAKLANMPTGRVKGRLSAGAGAPENLEAGAVRGWLNVANGATANQSDAHLLSRANHTGTQALSTVDGLEGVLDDHEERLDILEGGDALLPAGTSAVIIRDSVGDVVAVDAAPDGTVIVEDDRIRAVAKLLGDVFDVIEVDGSRNLGADDEGLSITTAEGEASRLRKRLLFVTTDPVSTAVTLTVPNNCPTLGDVVILVDGPQTGAVKVVTGDAGYINGSGPSAEVTIIPGRLFPLSVVNPGLTAPQVYTGWTLEDGKLEQVSASGTLNMRQHMGKVVNTTGNVVIPTIAGFHCVLVFGGAHTATFDGDVYTGASGDGLVVLVLSGPIIMAIPLPADALAEFV